MTTKTFLVTGQGIKSIPLNSLPESAWHTLVGQLTGNGGDEYIVTLYEHIPWLHRGVEARVNALANVPMAIHTGDASGEELDKTAYPFPVDMVRLLSQMYRFYILFARAYLWDMPSLLGQPTGLRLFHPVTMENVIDADKGIIGYERTIGTVTKPYTLEEIAYWYKAGVKDETSPGVSDAQVAASAAGILYDMDVHDQRFFKDGAINPTLISVSAGTQEPDRQRLRSWYKRVMGGVKNAFSIEVVEGKPEVTTFGYRPKDLVSVELTTQKREDIATALGVPQTMMFSNAANYATAAQDDLHFYDKTILPDAKRIENVLNNTIFEPMGLWFRFHPERMELFQQLEDSKATAVTMMLDKGVMELSEARAQMNLPPLAADDATQAEMRKQKQFEELRRAVESGIPVDVAVGILGIESPVALTSPAGAPPAKSAYDETILKWQRMALKRYKEAHPEKALTFHSDVIPETTAGAIRGALRQAKDSADVMRIFENALALRGYP